MTMICTNPVCRHRNKRKLRPLVISILPPTPTNHDDVPSNNSSNHLTTATVSDNGNNANNLTRQEQISLMFASHPSLVAHFEPPTFSPGVPSRELRNRLKFLEHCNDAGIIPHVEWEGICRAVREQEQEQQQPTTTTKSVAVGEDGVESTSEAKEISKVINPFRYLAVETLIQSSANVDDTTTDNDTPNTLSTNNNKTKKKKRWLEYETKSLIPISPHRRGSPEEVLLPYSMEIWRKAKTLNRDRSVLACTLAHLRAMKTLVGSSSEKENEYSSLNDDSSTSCNGKFDFILEDNVRAFVGMENNGKFPEEVDHNMRNTDTSGRSCECANRIWDIIEASNASQTQCHMRYYGWLGSLPNLSWIYENHIPRSALNDTTIQHDAGGCAMFPYPTNEDFELDFIVASLKSNKGDSKAADSPTSTDDDQLQSSSAKEHSVPQFSTPGGTAAVWGTFAYTVSPAAYHSFINQLQNDVGSLMWKGKKMRAYKCKPIDKLLPRHVKSEYEPKAVHVPSKVAFVRGPMTSLLHPQWDAGFRRSTEVQYHLSCDNDTKSSIDQITGDVWDHVWLGDAERCLVLQKENGEHSDIEEQTHSREKTKYRQGDRPSVGTTLNFSMLAIMMLLFVVADAFSFKHSLKLKNQATSGGNSIDNERKLGKIGKVPIISRTISIDVNIPPDLRRRELSEEHIYSLGDDIHRLDVTIWEMHQPSELIQEWWSIDRSEQERRVGDPFGVVMWPGSILASRELMNQHLCNHDESSITNATVLVLGAGTGVEALTAALLGAKRVIATDINPLTLKLLAYGANDDVRVDDNFSGEYFDLFSDNPLPTCDILVAADVLYNPELANQVGTRLHEAVIRSFDTGDAPLKVIVTDSQQFHGTNFLDQPDLHALNSLFEENNFERLEWKSYKLENVCGSGVLVDEDQTYDVAARMISWGW